jgi:hypothetical protein
MEPASSAGVMVAGRVLRSSAMQWRSATTDADDAMRGTGDDEIIYATGWTISGLATLGTILAIWVFAI